MITILTLLLLFLFQLKHFIVDFPLQGPYHYKNKGTYGHPGGIEHAGFHAIATMMFLPFFAGFEVALWLSVFEFLFHYHLDWAKMRINAIKGWGPTTHEQFWWLLGADQALHQSSYLVITAIALA